MNKDLNETELMSRSPNVLAYIGDAVLELYVRERLVRQGVSRLAELHKLATDAVSAKGQAKAYDKLVAILTEEELATMKRGRNTDSGSPPKNATVQEYRAATGVECLIGWLYLKGREERLNKILKICFEL